MICKLLFLKLFILLYLYKVLISFLKPEQKYPIQNTQRQTPLCQARALRSMVTTIKPNGAFHSFFFFFEWLL